MVSPHSRLRVLPRLLSALFVSASALLAIPGCSGGTEPAGSVEIKASPKEVAGQMFPTPETGQASKKPLSADTSAKPK